MSMRLTGALGLAFATLYFLYLTRLNGPDVSNSDSEAVAFWTLPGSQRRQILAATLCGVAVLLFVGFVVGLGQRLESGGAVAAAHVARLAGAVTAAMMLAGGALFAAPALALALNNEPVPTDGELGLLIRATSFAAHPFTLWFTATAAAGLVVATIAGRTALGWRRWTLVAGALVVAGLLAPLVFFGEMLLLLWVVAVSVSLVAARVRPLPLPVPSSPVR
jgi:hypothetical protein